MIPSHSGTRIRNPLQLVGFYLSWVESALIASLWAPKENWLQSLLICVVVLIGLSFASSCAFTLIYLTVRKPQLLYNPSDYAPEVQARLFETTPLIEVNNPPEAGT